MKLLGRALLRLGVVALLLFAMTVTYADAGGGRGGGGGSMHGGGRGGGKHGASHHHGSHGHRSVIIGVGPWWGPGWWGGWPYYGYYPYYPYYPYSYTPQATVAEPTTYSQRELEIQSPPQAYWYYCESAGGYYPTVQNCPESWLRVAPRDQ